MKVISWNCNLNFEKKYKQLEEHDADIIVIQECEKLDENYFPHRKFFWTGRIENKGLGVLIKDSAAKIHSCFNPNLINFLPVETDNFKILGVWAYNHRAIKFGDDVSGNTIDAIHHYEGWLSNDERSCIVVGDFNNSVIWDKANNQNNFENINKSLETLGFQSAYHVNSNEQLGTETQPTFFHTKNKTKQYHIDYIYHKGLKVNQVSIGQFSDWIKLSDHVPIFLGLD